MFKDQKAHKISPFLAVAGGTSVKKTPPTQELAIGGWPQRIGLGSPYWAGFCRRYPGQNPGLPSWPGSQPGQGILDTPHLVHFNNLWE